MKNKNHLLKIACVISLSLLLSSCVLTSDNPLGEKDAAIDDPELKGFWRRVDEEDPENIGYMAVMEGEDGYLKVLTFDRGIKGALEFRGFVSRIGDDRYLNLQYVGDIGSNLNFGEEYIFLHYRVDNKNELVMAVFKEDFFKKAVKEGRIKGEVKQLKTSYGYTDGDTRLKTSTKELADFIKNQDKKDFLDTESILHKISEP